jgi:hypothetical protein
MKRQNIATLSFVLGFWLVAWIAPATGEFSSGPTDVKPSNNEGRESRTPVVVELFTSEGCSDCPPADKVLSWLAESQPVKDAEIIPLSEHVDYWNHLGWSDPYSSSAFSERQRDYSNSLGSEVYTPQMIVDGKVEFVGSDAGKALKAISSESRTPRITVNIHPISRADASERNSVSFSVRVETLPPLDPKTRGQVLLAVTEDNLQSSVARGENSGRTLAHTAVVRELKTIGKLNARPDAAFVAEPTIEISREWKRQDLRAIVFVEAQGTHRILGAAETHIPSL